MPSVSPAQEKFMRARAHGWVPPKSRPDLRKVPVDVAQDFHEADMRKHNMSPNKRRRMAKALRGD